MVEKLGKHLWLNCDGCQRAVMADVREFTTTHRLDMNTPLLTDLSPATMHALWEAKSPRSTGAARLRGQAIKRRRQLDHQVGVG